MTVSVGGHSRSLGAGRLVAACLAVAAVLIASGLLAGRWTAPVTSPGGPARTTVGQVDPGPVSGGRVAVRTADVRCAVGRPC